MAGAYAVADGTGKIVTDGFPSRESAKVAKKWFEHHHTGDGPYTVTNGKNHPNGLKRYVRSSDKAILADAQRWDIVAKKKEDVPVKDDNHVENKSKPKFKKGKTQKKGKSE
jgi:hypothetical protein